MRRAVFLDRDGVLNRAPVHKRRPCSPERLADFELLPGVPGAISRLRNAGFYLVVVTNQPTVARGLQSRQVVEAMHLILRQALGLHDIRVCYHDDGAGCACRKPLPGMIFDAATELGIDLGASFMVGDRWRDVVAGRGAGCRTILIDYDYAETLPIEPDYRVGSLAEATDLILLV